MAGCKARMKLAYSALIDLNSRLVNYFYAHFAANTWKISPGNPSCPSSRTFMPAFYPKT
jgi:hypothetical protein